MANFLSQPCCFHIPTPLTDSQSHSPLFCNWIADCGAGIRGTTSCVFFISCSLWNSCWSWSFPIQRGGKEAITADFCWCFDKTSLNLWLFFRSRGHRCSWKGLRLPQAPRSSSQSNIRHCSIFQSCKCSLGLRPHTPLTCPWSFSVNLDCINIFSHFPNKQHNWNL